MNSNIPKNTPSSPVLSQQHRKVRGRSGTVYLELRLLPAVACLAFVLAYCGFLPSMAAGVISGYHQRAEAATAQALDLMSEEPFPEWAIIDFASFERTMRAVAVTEQEPNDRATEAIALAPGQPGRGALLGRDRDYWSVSIPKGRDPGERFRLLVAHEEGEGYASQVNVSIESELRSFVTQRYRFTGAGMLNHLDLAPGDYRILVEGDGGESENGTAYYLLLDVEVHDEAVESEPNSGRNLANPLSPGDSILGSTHILDRSDWLVVTFEAKHRASRWELRVVTEDADAAIYVQIQGPDSTILSQARGQGRLAIGDLNPAPGEYHIALQGPDDRDASYRLALVEVGPQPDNWESEPNGHISSPTLSILPTPGKKPSWLHGRFQGNDVDFFTMDVTDSDRLYTLQLNSAAGKSLRLHDSRGDMLKHALTGSDGVATLGDLRLALGIHHFSVDGSSGDYTIEAMATPIPSPYFEWEPNDTPNLAQTLVLGAEHTGKLPDNRDIDCYRLVVRQAMEFQVSLVSGEGGVAVFTLIGDGFTQQRRVADRETGRVEETFFLLPGDYILQLRAEVATQGFYRLKVDAISPWQSDGGEVTLVPISEKLQAAAFYEGRQRVDQKLGIHNTSDRAITLEWLGQSGHHGVGLQTASLPPVMLKPNQRMEVAIPWEVEAQSWSDDAVPLFVALKVGDSIVATTRSSLKLVTDGVPVAPDFSIPEHDRPIMGGLNLNALSLGAKAVVPPAEGLPESELPTVQETERLMDGVLSRRSFNGFVAMSELVGGGQVPIAGISLDLHGRGSLWESVKTFAIDLSHDGKAFRQVFQGETRPITGEQRFVFSKLEKGKFARIRLLTRFDDGDEKRHLGQWRVIAQPGAAIPGMGVVNLLDSGFGGNLIHESDDAAVYGFHHGRATRITGLRWVNSNPLRLPEGASRQVRIDISMDSAVGPWAELTTLDLAEADGPALEAGFSFEGAPWARFVRFGWVLPEGVKRWQKAKDMAVFELETSAEHYSLLGEWGGPVREAYWEWQQRVLGHKASETIERLASSPQSPHVLKPSQEVRSVVWINEGWEDHYRIEPVARRRALEVAVEGSPFVKVALEVQHEDGTPVSFRNAGGNATRRVFQWIQEPGDAYRLRVFEPKRSIIYLWDVSGSMGAFVPSIEQAVLQFAKGINPETEKVQLLPFDEPPKFLLKDWSSDTYTLQHTIRNYTPPSSSYAHLNLLAATELLAKEEGTRAALVITDCESSRLVNAQLWHALEEVQPTVFTFQTSDATASYQQEQDDMQNWSAVGGGAYFSTRAAHELDAAFARVQAHLRRPAPYQIALTVPELKPGFIAVEDARDPENIKDPTQEALLLIIDASASMRLEMPDGRTRMQAARDTLLELVDRHLPDGSQFGLRVFGHRGSPDCVSVLVIPVGPLDKAAVRKAIQDIRVSSLGNTALAESISWAPKDLAAVKGSRKVVVLTDGEETCRGDLARVIAELASQGLEVNVNIVGFNLDSPELGTRYAQWVRASGGDYYDAKDAAALGEALRRAMTPTPLPKFRILDSAGTVIGEGTVGDPAIRVESGSYRVEVLDGTAPSVFEIEAYERTVRIPYIPR